MLSLFLQQYQSVICKRQTDDFKKSLQQQTPQLALAVAVEHYVSFVQSLIPVFEKCRSLSQNA
jgi:hypothetical protein